MHPAPLKGLPFNQPPFVPANLVFTQGPHGETRKNHAAVAPKAQNKGFTTAVL